jgi:hypothetical protein
MTVRELITKLSCLPPDMKVVVDGFDGWGYDDPVIDLVLIRPSTDQRKLCDYNDAHDLENTSLTHPIIKAVFLK